MNEYREIKTKAEDLFLSAKTKGNRRFALLVLLALESGARVSDLLRLEFSDFVKENDLYYLNYYNKKSSKYQEAQISERTIKKVNVLKNDSASSLVFYNDNKNAVLSRITANRKCTQIFGFNFHNLRKIAGKNIASQKGVVHASKYLGHTKVSITDLYLGISKNQFKKDMLDCNI